MGNLIRKTRFGCIVAVALAVVPSVASAQANPAAEALFNSGREAMARGDYEHACQQLRESNRIEPAIGTQFNLADCEEKRGKLATAWTLFRAVEQKVPTGDERGSIAKERAYALEGRLPEVTLRLASGAPKDTTVRDGDVELGSASFGVPIPIDPGPHEFIVSAPGRPTRKFHVVFRAGETRSLEVQPGGSSEAETRPAVARPDTATPAPSHGSSTRTLGWVLGGVGIAGIGVGAVAGIMVLGKKNTADEACPAKQCTDESGLKAIDAAKTFQVVSNVGWVVGVLGLGFGTYFVLTGGERATTTIGFAPIREGGRLSVNYRW